MERDFKIGDFVQLKENCIYNDQHNPHGIIGKIVLIGNPNNDCKRTVELPIVVDWGGFTNTYGYRMIEHV